MKWIRKTRAVISSLFAHRLVRVGLAVIVVLAVMALSYGVIAKLTVTKDNPNTEKVLTLDDLDNPSVQLNSETSDTSIDNLTQQLKAKIDKQITDKENPIDTAQTLIGVLCKTTNASRSTQCVEYIAEFLNTKMDALKLTSDEYGQPDELQIMYWRAQLYTDLVYGYGLIRNSNFTGSDGKPIDAVKEELKYVDLYLAIAQNTANWGEPQTAYDGHVWYYYEYTDINDFIELRKQLEAAGV